MPQHMFSLAALSAKKAPFFAQYPLDSAIDALAWLQEYPSLPRMYWKSRDGTLECAGIGIAEPHYTSIQQAQERLQSRPYPLRAFGGRSFSKNSDGWGEFGKTCFWIPQILYVRDHEKHQVFHTLLQKTTPITPFIPPSIQNPHPSFAHWKSVIDTVYSDFKEKTLEKIVLARQLRLSIPHTPCSLLQNLQNPAVSSFSFLFSPHGASTFLGSSPERLFSLQNRTIHSEALAGTRPKGTNPQELLESEKDRREHHIVFKHIQNQLAPLCESLQHNTQPHILSHNHVIHLHTQIQGTLKRDPDVAQLLDLLHPTPAVCGLPQKRSLQRIQELEGFDRGWYAGPVGWISADEAEFSVGIRSALHRHDSYYIWAGAGIVQGSRAQEEWKEIESKSRQYLLLAQS